MVRLVTQFLGCVEASRSLAERGSSFVGKKIRRAAQSSKFREATSETGQSTNGNIGFRLIERKAFRRSSRSSCFTLISFLTPAGAIVLRELGRYNRANVFANMQRKMFERQAQPVQHRISPR
jgi:hypothetical protein